LFFLNPEMSVFITGLDAQLKKTVLCITSSIILREARNKDCRRFREHNTRKTGRITTNKGRK